MDSFLRTHTVGLFSLAMTSLAILVLGFPTMEGDTRAKWATRLEVSSNPLLFGSLTAGTLWYLLGCFKLGRITT